MEVKVCMMVDLSSRQVISPFDGDIFRGHQMREQKRERQKYVAFEYFFQNQLL